MEHNTHEKYLIFHLTRILQPEMGKMTGSENTTESGRIRPELQKNPLVIPYSCGITISANNFAFS